MNASQWVLGSIAGVAALGIAGAALVVALDGEGHDMHDEMAAGAGMMGGMGGMNADMPMEGMMGSQMELHQEHMAQHGAASEMMGGSEMAVMHRMMNGMMQGMGQQADGPGAHNDHHPGAQ